MEDFLNSLVKLRDVLSAHPMFAIGILLTFGYFLGKLVAKFKLPEITGFIIAGLVMGQSLSGVITHEMGKTLTIVTEVALGLIALTIGGEFAFSKLKRMGKEVLVITMIQLLFSFTAVAAGLYFFKMPLPFALLLGAIASATAPAATVAIVQSLRAHGKFVDYLYGVVALDDAGCVILFGVIFSFVSGMLGFSGAAQAGGLTIALHAVKEVLLSLLIGVISGFLVHAVTRKMKNNSEILLISLGLILMGTAVSIVFHLSPLLTNMVAGAVIINLSPRNHRIFRVLEPLTPPIYALFFIMAGIELRPGVIFKSEILLLGLVYIGFRAIGKYGGVYLGCKLSKTSGSIKKYLGFCMLPQAGVAIGLVLLIQTSPMMAQLTKQAPQYAKIVSDMVNIVLLSVFVNEMVGPPLSKMAITKGNEMEE